MRIFFAVSALALLALSNVSAGRLDVAVIQFPEEKTPEELSSAFASQNLYEMTNSNRTRTDESYLKGGYILFAQSLAAARTGTFGSATRIKDSRADIEGQLGASNVSVTVTLTEGLKVGLRSFEKKVFSGAGSLPSGSPQILSIKQIKVKSPSVNKGQAKIERYMVTTVVVAQYTP